MQQPIEAKVDLRPQTSTIRPRITVPIPVPQRPRQVESINPVYRIKHEKEKRCIIC
jgi:hypothetical protein